MALSPEHNGALRIAVRSDRRLFRDSLTACLAARPGYTVVGHAADLDDLFVLCELRHPDVALVDVGAGLDNGYSTVRRLADCVARCHVIVVYERLTPAELTVLWRLGVDTLVPGSHGLDALLVVLDRHRTEGRARYRAASHANALTEREYQVLTLVSAGHTADRIAELLDISSSAVANMKRRIYQKLDVASQSQAVARAAALGLVGLPSFRPAPPSKATRQLTVRVRGAAGRARQQVVSALRTADIPFNIDENLVAVDGKSRPFENKGGDAGPSSMTILIDPRETDWSACQGRDTPIALVCSVPPPPAEALTALLRGAVALVCADRVAQHLVPALTLASQGYLAIEAAAAYAMLEVVRAPHGLPELTARESDILRSIADGHTVRQTARSLGIAEKTVENTQARLFRKLGARNRAGALAAAYSFGLLELVSSEAD